MVIDKIIESCIPQKAKELLDKYPDISEIRIRKNKPLMLCSGSKNVVLDCVSTKEDVEKCITFLCKNSVHTYFDFINQGYIPCENGYKVGVCGNAVIDKKSIINVSEITSINIRIPSKRTEIPIDFLRNLPFRDSLLIYSSPNVGKTTFLKIVAAHLASPPHNKKVCVIDCKNEIYSEELHRNCPIDFFIGYPKYEAIDMAVRNMSPEYIVCDEIGLTDDVYPLVMCKNAGVSLICSAHAKNLNELIGRDNIAEMHNKKTFGGYVGISVKNGVRHYCFTRCGEV